MSKQSDYQARKRAAGLCIQCGKRPIHPLSKCQCWYCATKARARARKRYGQQPRGYKITRQSDLRAA